MAAPKGSAGRVPHVYVIIFALIVAVALASLVIPAGSFERNDAGRVVPGSFRFDKTLPQGAEEIEPSAAPRGWSLLLIVLMAPLRGISSASDIIAFLLIIGGSFKIIERTGAFETAMLSAVTRLGKTSWIVIPASMLVFSIGGATFGMSEEVLPFVILFVPLAQALGYDRIIGVAIPLVGAGVGFAGAMINPFTVGIAQAIAGLPPLSGMAFRTGIWALVTLLGIVFVLRLARRLRREDGGARSAPAPSSRRLQLSQVGVLTSLAGGLALIVWGIERYEWYVTEIGAIFLAIGLLAGLFARIPPNTCARSFLEGGRELLPAALVVGFARGIVLLADETRILDPILYGMATTLEALPGIVSINLMFVFQSLLNFMVPSGSGQAALTMPIMAPLAELSGLTRQVAVLAFQFGDGFSNLIIPTSAVLMGCLEAGKVSYERWFRYAWPLQAWLFLFGVISLSVAVWAGF